jgi:hypothetical protein
MLVKTSRPRFSAVYQRARLLNRLDAARRQNSVTLVCGPPGAGKTTLLSSYLASRQLDCLWYQVDSGDNDAATLFHYFSHAAIKHLAAGHSPLREFHPETALDLTNFSRQYFREFYAGVKAPLIIVLDNYQELAANSPSHHAVRIACEEASEVCHIIIATRESCPKALARMRLNQALTIIGADDLTLTLEETRGIAKSSRGKQHSAAETLALHKRSAGWMMGLMLILERSGRNPASADLNFCRQDGHDEPTFDYFADEVFNRLSSEARDLLLQCALLPKMTMDRVTLLTGTSSAVALLLDLMRKNHFVTFHGGTDTAYQFHPLFREFLLNQRSVRYSVGELTQQQHQAAEILIADGDAEAAIDLLEQAGDWQRMTDVILTTAPALHAQGRIATLALWLKRMPAQLHETNPWLLYWCGIGKSLAEPGACQATLELAYRRLCANDDLLGMALSWSGVMDCILGIHTEFAQMDCWVAEFNDRLETRLEQLPADLRSRVTLTYFVALSFRQPQHPNMPVWLAWVRRTLECATSAEARSQLRYHLVRHHILRGEHAEAEAVLSMLRCADNVPATERPPRTVVDHISEATVAMHVGMKERCLRAVSEGLHAAEGTGNRLFDSILLQLGAAMSLNRGEFAHADGFLAKFERLAEALPFVDRGAYYAVVAWRRFQAGESALALQLLARAVAASEARGTPYYIAVDNLGFGLLLHLCGRSVEAIRHLELGRRVGQDIQNSLIEYAYLLFSAHLSLDFGRDSEARLHLEKAMRLGHQHGYMHFFFFPPPVIARLCLVALEAGIEPAYVGSLIERNELAADPAWRHSEAWPWPIRIYTLGRFAVVKHGVALRFVGKAQKKPLDLLKALIAFGGREVPEAKLADALWPGAEGDAAAQALATTLFRLRKLIGERAIRRQESRLTLDPSCCWVDCWAFERLSNDPSADQPVRLDKLRKLHQGPFLDGADDAPWAQPMRDRLHAKLARLVRTFAGTMVFGASACEDAGVLLVEALLH